MARVGEDLGRRALLDDHPAIHEDDTVGDILAFGPHVDAEGFRAAKAAGASECVARGSAVERVLKRLSPDA